jgi:predicted small secreted protein
MAVGALLLAGCETWHGLGKDIEKTGDSMQGRGTYRMPVHSTPNRVTAAAIRAVEQMKMTDINSSVDRNIGTVTARTTRQDGVIIEIAQSGQSDSVVTIYTHGDDADEVSRQIQNQINRNL